MNDSRNFWTFFRREKTIESFDVLDRWIAEAQREAAFCSADAQSFSCIRVMSSEHRETRFDFEVTRWNMSNLLSSFLSSSLSIVSSKFSQPKFSFSSDVISCVKDLTKTLLLNILTLIIWSVNESMKSLTSSALTDEEEEVDEVECLFMRIFERWLSKTKKTIRVKRRDRAETVIW